ncbi:acyl-CoA N-acyltransferase [Aspergillus avenaceus]|uniref:Acyl-CoA N-acyltransferase n=1 Tax=Aspergillus avenaceus TaxID=36643 RepID=A0A5N6TNV3_ASPAV|nr:acyl-CoA N-acyltransferase [Aspergillus avenaceus]
MPLSHLQQSAKAKICLPHPYLTSYYLLPTDKIFNQSQLFQFCKGDDHPDGQTPESDFHNDLLYFTEPQPVSVKDGPKDSDNTAWARAQRSPLCAVTWEATEPPTLSQVWLVLYGIFSTREIESFRLRLHGPDRETVSQTLKQSCVAIDHPKPIHSSSTENQQTSDDLLVLRSAFWQGCGSPFGGRPAWTPEWDDIAVPYLDHTVTLADKVYKRHPRRAPKPAPGSIVYSRYIPFLDEHFSLVALDYQKDEHLQLFHKWQNDPRVAKGWKETGSLEHHRNYLRNLHEDPHVLTVLGRFNDTPFSYFEIFWAKEDPIGVHYDAQDFDRGRHTLVGDANFRGPHRVMAWWPSIIHYTFLSDHRTEQVIGEPVSSNDKVHSYDYTFGLHQDQLIDLPHKRASLVKCSRERFFQLCPFNQGRIKLAGTGLHFQSKL